MATMTNKLKSFGWKQLSKQKPGIFIQTSVKNTADTKDRRLEVEALKKSFESYLKVKK